MPNCERLLLMGKGGASVFCPLKSLGLLRPGGNCAVPGGRDTQQRVRGVTPTSDVNDRIKVKANTGATAAAGVVTGARLGQPGVPSGEGPDGTLVMKCRSGGEWPE